MFCRFKWQLFISFQKDISFVAWRRSFFLNSRNNKLSSVHMENCMEFMMFWGLKFSWIIILSYFKRNITIRLSIEHKYPKPDSQTMISHRINFFFCRRISEVMSYCKFWIYWMGVNAEFAIHLIVNFVFTPT